MPRVSAAVGIACVRCAASHARYGFAVVAHRLVVRRAAEPPARKTPNLAVERTHNGVKSWFVLHKSSSPLWSAHLYVRAQQSQWARRHRVERPSGIPLRFLSYRLTSKVGALNEAIDVSIDLGPLLAAGNNSELVGAAHEAEIRAPDRPLYPRAFTSARPLCSAPLIAQFAHVRFTLLLCKVAH
jgi:hypothetical protein